MVLMTLLLLHVDYIHAEKCSDLVPLGLILRVNPFQEINHHSMKAGYDINIKLC